MGKRLNAALAKKAVPENHGTPGSAQRSKTDEHIIKTGIFLPCFCPLCSHSLIEDDKIGLAVPGLDESVP